MSLKHKTVLTVLLPVAIVFVLVITLVGVQVNNSGRTNAIDLSEATARDYASRMQAALEVPLAAAQNTATIIEGLMQSKTHSRAAVNALLQKMLTDNPDFFGTWVGFEPNAFDGRDADYAGRAAHDATGRFIPYWYRDGAQVDTEELKDYLVPGDGDYYLLARDSGKQTLLEPFTYEVGGREVLMTTFAVPIYPHNDKGYETGQKMCIYVFLQ